jgi:hypothetical protein
MYWNQGQKRFIEPSDSGEYGLGWCKVSALVETLIGWHSLRTGVAFQTLGFGVASFNVVKPECLRYILSDNFENYQEGKLDKFFKGLYGKSRVPVNGRIWRLQRHALLASLIQGTVQYGSVCDGGEAGESREILG